MDDNEINLSTEDAGIVAKEDATTSLTDGCANGWTLQVEIKNVEEIQSGVRSNLLNAIIAIVSEIYTYILQFHPFPC